MQRFEAIAQRLVEGSLGRLLGGRLDPLEISAELTRTIERTHKHGYAPNHFQIQLHPTDFTYLRTKWPDVAAVLTDYVVNIAKDANLVLRSDPQVELLASPDIQRHFAHIHATHVAGDVESTAMFAAVKVNDPLEALTALDAFVIVDGGKHIALDKAQLTLGRRTECDIVLEGAQVSRRHAQIRWRFGRFVIFDLGSRAGTFVNQEPISEFVLRPGDVIQLADVRLIYGEGLAQTHAHKPIRPHGQMTEARPPVKPD